jgi:glycogen synthase
MSTAASPATGRLRVLMVAARFAPFSGGTEAHVREVSRRLVAAGHAVTVLTGNPGGRLPASECLDGIEVRRIRAWPAKGDQMLAPGLAAAIWAGRWDVAHVQGYHTAFAPLAMIALAARRIPFALTFHSGGHSSGIRRALRPIQYLLLAPLVRLASRLVAVSRFEASFFAGAMGLPFDRFDVVQNGAQLPPPRDPKPRDPERPLIMSVGRLERYKGHHRAIAGFAKLLGRFPEARLRVLGEGPYEGELRDLAGQLGIAHRVDFGALPPDQREGMADLLASASLVVLLSDYEAHPIAVMEAASLGVPVLTSDTSGFRELAEQGVVSAIPLRSNADETAEAMEGLLGTSSPTVRAELPTWEECVGRLSSLYVGLTRKARPARPGRGSGAVASGTRPS